MCLPGQHTHTLFPRRGFSRAAEQQEYGKNGYDNFQLGEENDEKKLMIAFDYDVASFALSLSLLIKSLWPIGGTDRPRQTCEGDAASAAFAAPSPSLPLLCHCSHSSHISSRRLFLVQFDAFSRQQRQQRQKNPLQRVVTAVLTRTAATAAAALDR